MKRHFLCIAIVAVTFLAASAAWAGPDWEFSGRHQALAETGNAVFNIRGLSPTLENIACLVGSPQYNILFEGYTSTANSLPSDDQIDYYFREINGMLGLKTTYPTLQRDEDYDFAERLSIGFIPGTYINTFHKQHTYQDSEDEWKEDETRVQFFQRFGIAYGINEYVAIGVGFTIVPPTIIRVTHSGKMTETDEDGNEERVDQQDDYTIWAPMMFSPEIGVLVRPVEFIQLGLAYENGDLKSRSSEVTHTYYSEEKDLETTAVVARSPSLGVGFGIMIPDIDNFMVGFDFDSEFRRGESKETGYYADNQEMKWSVSVEKAWEMSSIKGGFGYADEVGTRRFFPYDKFFMAFGTDLFFDEHVNMGFSFRLDTGYLEADPKGSLAFGGGFGWTLGGSF